MELCFCFCLLPLIASYLVSQSYCPSSHNFKPSSANNFQFFPTKNSKKMTSKMTKISLVLVFVVMFLDGITAQSGCTKTLMGLYPCLNYVNGNSSTPSTLCCLQLSSVVKSQPQCLCVLLNGDASSYGVSINQTLALALPGACNVQTLPVSRCKEGNGPSTPAGSPADSSKTPENSTKPSVPTNPSGSKVVPSTDGTSNGGSNLKTPFSVAGFLLLASSCAFSVTGF